MSNYFQIAALWFFVGNAMLFVDRKMASRKWKIFARYCFGVGAILLPLTNQVSPKEVIIATVTLLVALGIDRLNLREKVDFASNDNLQNIVSFVLGSSLKLGVLGGYVLIKSQLPTYGVSNWGIPVAFEGIFCSLVITFKQYWLHRFMHESDFYWHFQKPSGHQYQRQKMIRALPV